MYITQAARQAKSDSTIVVAVLMMAVAAAVWLVTRLLSR